MNWANKYVGLPFSQHKCWELVVRVYADQLTIDLPTYGEISDTNLVAVARQMKRDGNLPPWYKFDGPLKEFDIAMLSAKEGGEEVVHVGIIVGSSRLLHTENATACVCVALNDPKVRHRIRGYRRHEQCL